MKIRRPSREYLERAEVRTFYTQLRDEVMTKRALGSAELVIPEVVLDRIRLAIGDYSNLLREVEVVSLNGPARAILDGAIPEAIWTEMTDEVKEMATAFRKVELDGFKVGGFIPVANAILEDSMINLASYVEDRIARAIAKAIDKAILIGTGAAGKQPVGIIPSIHADNAIEVDGKLATILSKVGLIDTGEDFCGEVIAVMKRKTYYERILPQTVVNTSDGRQVVQGVNDPNIAGLRVVFSQYAPADTVILGEFKRYMLSERAGIQLARSEHVRFIADQTVFKGTARYDGKPIDIDAENKTKAFAKLVLKAAPAAEDDEEAA